MMINKRLIDTVEDSKKYVAGNVAFQWCSLAANITMMGSITHLIQKMYEKTADISDVTGVACVALAAVLIRYICTVMSSRMGYLSSRTVKKSLREMIYLKLLRIGASYDEKIQTSEVVQVAVEGVDQLETYFGAYLPQFFYAMLAPLTLFVVVSFVNVLCALVLLICVPLIPVTIVVIQRWAKKLLSRYWGQYTALGDTFLENLQGLTTIKIYQADDFKQKEMNEEAEKFRKITMKVLTMQLNSITVMDLIAYGGAAIGMILSVSQFKAGHISLGQCLFIILIAADFFIPMRVLGSFFHIAMNGMAACDKIFRLLDLPDQAEGSREKNLRPMPEQADILCRDVRFSYEEGREVLHGVSMEFPVGSFTAIVGESGCGKSTMAAILMGRNRYQGGSVRAGDVEWNQIQEASLMRHITYIGHDSYLFKGTVADNLLLGNPKATEEQMWKILDQTRLSDFLHSEKGLETQLLERGSNLSGGQRQRLALARALLHDSPVYIFDEATSNIDVESENDIMDVIMELSHTRTVILISHRLANVVWADRIYVMEAGQVAETGRHGELVRAGGVYARLWNAQQQLENYGKEA